MYLGEIRIFACNFEPTGWATCNGQVVLISRYTALFSVIGNVYGGNPSNTFQLPNLQGSAAMHWGDGPGLTSRYVGEAGGDSMVTLISDQLPAHNHSPAASAPSDSKSPAGEVWGATGGRPAPMYYTSNYSPVAMAKGILQATGGNLPHNNLMPYLGITFCVALEGIFPNRTLEP